MTSDSPTGNTLYLVDGSSYLYRAFHALPNLTNSAGQPTGALLGVANMLRRLIREAEQGRIAVVFDAKGPTFRHEMYAEYKANRPPMPADLSDQVDAIHELVRLLGLPLVQVEGVEADDVIGTLSAQSEAAGMSCVISTGDKDLAQLVTDQTTLVNTMSETRMDRQGVQEKFGVRPEQIVDFLALTGDQSDNIPGVDKCGPKTAAKWLQSYGDLDGVMSHADEFGGKIGENLRSALEILPLSRALATVRRDLDLEAGPENFERAPGDEDALRAFLQRYEFNSWLKELGEPAAETQAATDYSMVLTREDLQAWIERLEQCQLFAFDTETTDLDPMRAELVGLSFSLEPGEAAYVPVAHDYAGAPRQLPPETVLKALKPVLCDESIGKIGQHIKYDMNVLSRYGIHMRGVAFDTMLESYVFNSTGSRHDMDSLALKYLGRQTTHYEDIAGKGARQISFSQVDLETAAHYAAEDADITLQLHQNLWPRLEKTPSLAKVLREIEIPLIPVLARMEQRGVLIDGKLLAVQSREMAQQMRALEEQVYAEAGQPFNLDSPKQLQEILFEKLELPVIRKTPKGQPSTAEDVLQELAHDYALPKLILEYRSLSKLRSTYTDRLPEQINPDTGRVHTSYHQAVAATGRLSSSGPNLQNIPIRTEQGRAIRSAFTAGYPDWLLMGADYSQIELRVLAHYSGDEALLAAYAEDADIHRRVAAEVHGISEAEVTDEMRRVAKTINFGIVYGQSPFGLARTLRIPQDEAAAYIETYFARYPGVQAFMLRTLSNCRQCGYVETMLGRRRRVQGVRDLENLDVSKRRSLTEPERIAVNTVIQGSAADLIKQAMLRVHARLKESQMAAKLLLQIHDELLFEVDPQAADDLEAMVREEMIGVAELKVPLKVDIARGLSWAEV